MCWPSRKPKPQPSPIKEEGDGKKPPNLYPGPGAVAYNNFILRPCTPEGVPEWKDPHPKQETTYGSKKAERTKTSEPFYEKQLPQLNSDSDGTKAEESKKTKEPDWKPPPSPETMYIPNPEPHMGNQLRQSKSDSDDTKARNSKKPSGFYQKPTGPDARTPNTSLPATTERPKLSSHSEDQVTRKSKGFDQKPTSPEARTPNTSLPTTTDRLKFSSDSEDQVIRNSKKTSGFDHKPTGPEARTPNTSQPTTTERPKLSSDSEDQVTRKVSEIKRPPLPSPENQKMISREPLENTPHKCPTIYKIEENTTECHTSAPEKQTAKPIKTSSNDKKDKNSTRAIRSSQTTEKEDTESISNDPIFSATSQTVPSDSEGNQKSREGYW